MTYTLWLLLTLAAITATNTLMLPATTAWASTHGPRGWAIWLIWACLSLAVLHHAITHPHPRVSVHLLHAAAVAAIVMAITAPGEWTQALTATGGTTIVWLIANLAARRPRTA